MDYGGENIYINKLQFKKRTGQRHALLGGEFIPVMQRSNPNLPCKTLDLNIKVRPIETEFCETSKKFMMPDADLGIALDENRDLYTI
jgi:hypothetical protein